MASSRGHSHIVRYLVEEQLCNPVCADKDGVTPLHHASQKGHLDVVYLLTEYGGDPQVTNHEGVTPLHAASMGGHVDVVKYLIENKTATPSVGI